MSLSASSKKPVSYFLSIFASDALTLGSHWVYNSDEIRAKYNIVKSYDTPTMNDYHKGKRAGDFTHMGDSSRIVLESLAQKHHWDQKAYLQHWTQRWDTLQTTSYFDSATKDTLKNLKEGKTLPEAASEDNDIGHTAKSFPLLLVSKTEAEYVKNTLELVTSSQKIDIVKKSAEYLAKVTWRVLHNKAKPSIVFQEVADEMKDDFITKIVKAGLDSKSEDDEKAIASFGEKKEIDRGGKKFTLYMGKSCSVEYGIPAVIHFVTKYQDAEDPTVALYEDTTVGGHSAGRNLAIAAIIYAYRGVEFKSIQGLIEQLNERKQLEALIEQV